MLPPQTISRFPVNSALSNYKYFNITLIVQTKRWPPIDPADKKMAVLINGQHLHWYQNNTPMNKSTSREYFLYVLFTVYETCSKITRSESSAADFDSYVIFLAQGINTKRFFIYMNTLYTSVNTLSWILIQRC